MKKLMAIAFIAMISCKKKNTDSQTDALNKTLTIELVNVNGFAAADDVFFTANAYRNNNGTNTALPLIVNGVTRNNQPNITKLDFVGNKVNFATEQKSSVMSIAYTLVNSDAVQQSIKVNCFVDGNLKKTINLQTYDSAQVTNGTIKIYANE